MNPDQEELLAEMLADLEEISGVPLEEIMASEFEEARDDWRESDVYEEESESEPLDLDNDYDMDVGDYLDELVDDYDVGDSEDAYGDEAL